MKCTQSEVVAEAEDSGVDEGAEVSSNQVSPHGSRKAVVSTRTVAEEVRGAVKVKVIYEVAVINSHV